MKNMENRNVKACDELFYKEILAIGRSKVS